MVMERRRIRPFKSGFLRGARRPDERWEEVESKVEAGRR